MTTTEHLPNFEPTGDSLQSWTAYEDALRDLRTAPDSRWIFRGVLKTYDARTSFDRLCNGLDIAIPEERAKLERRLLRDFRRHPEGAVMAGASRTETWALMQHHGAPTRLMDWTYSPYVAAFFAYDMLLKHRSNDTSTSRLDDQAAVWALNTTWLNRWNEQHLPNDAWKITRSKKQDARALDVLLRYPPQPFVMTHNPFTLNERLSVQQAVSCVPSDITKTWVDNLRAMGWSHQAHETRCWALSLDIGDALNELLRRNVTMRSLKPGLDGYAESLWHRSRLLLDVPVEDDEED